MSINNHNQLCSEGCYGLCCTKVLNFGVTIGNNEILKDVNLHIHCGELTAIIGPNGAGKSTLFKAMLDEIKHTGKLIFNDARGVRSTKPVIGYVPQHLNFDTGTPASVLDLFSVCNSKMPVWLYTTRRTRQRASESLSLVKAEHLIDRRLGALSGGELQRVLLALALDPIPDLLLLDEPVSGIDQNGLSLFYKTVSEIRSKYDMSIVLISHDFNMISKYADRVILLNKTVLCCGTAQEVFDNAEMCKIFGMQGFLHPSSDKIDKEDN